MIKDQVQTLLQTAAGKTGIDETIVLDVPTQKNYGDYATSIALKSVKKLKKAPFLIAQEIVMNIPPNAIISKTEIIKPGFINVWIQETDLKDIAIRLSKNDFIFSPFHFGKEKKVIVEFAHPNTHKLFHIGHMRNISTGETMVRLLEAVGNKVIRANYQGDVGLHIAKCLYQIQKQEVDITSLKTLQEKIELLGKAYSEGQQAYEQNEDAKKQIHEINKMIYDMDPKIVPLWKETVKWSLEYFDEIYKRVGSRFDRCYFESEMFERGIEICSSLLEKGIFEKSEGAVVLPGKKYGVDTRVFINSLGLPTYEGKELALAEKEFADFGTIDKCIHVVTPEQTSFFQVTFKTEELMDEKKFKGKQYHLAYNWVQLKNAKMSSRTGNVVQGMWLIDEAKKRLLEKFTLDEKTAEILAVASVKYSFLKVSTQMEILFSFEDSITLEGNSAPYLIYTYVRTQSILDKDNKSKVGLPMATPGQYEIQLMRKLYQYEEKVYEAAKNMSPNVLTSYLFELAQEFNLFYQKSPILKAEESMKQLRIVLTQAVGNTIQNGLYLLGIQTVKKM